MFSPLLDSHRPAGSTSFGSSEVNRLAQYSPSASASYGPSFIQGSLSFDRPTPNTNNTASPTQLLPRSASEAAMESNANKYRQLPCRTFISVGTCPYRERCVYLHDPRCICREAKTKTRRKNKEDTVLDSLFWPIMPYAQVAAKLDSNRQPHVIQQYMVPPPQSEQYRNHDEAVYSMWMHFVDFCSACSESIHVLDADSAPCYMAPDMAMNMYTNKLRLPVFRTLSAGHSMVEEVPSKSVFHSPAGVHQIHEESRVARMGSFDSIDSSITMSDMSSNRSSFQDEEGNPLLLGARHHPVHTFVGDGHILSKNAAVLPQRYSPDNSASIWTSLSCEKSRGILSKDVATFAC